MKRHITRSPSHLEAGVGDSWRDGEGKVRMKRVFNGQEPQSTKGLSKPYSVCQECLSIANARSSVQRY
jgi:hypothetical protein